MSCETLSAKSARAVKLRELRMSHQQRNGFRQRETAYYVDEKHWVIVLSRGAFISLVKYSMNDVGMEVYVDNADLIFKEDEDTDAL
jgi:hypothetical protein